MGREAQICIYSVTKTDFMKAALNGTEVTRSVAHRDKLSNVTIDASNLYFTTTPKTGRNAGKVMKMPQGGGMPATLASAQHHPGDPRARERRA